MTAHVRRKAPKNEASKRRHEPKPKGPPLFQRPEPTVAEIKSISQELGAAHRRVTETRPLRFDTPQDWQAWVEAVRQKYTLYKAHVTLPAQHFSREIIPEEVARYDWDFWQGMELLRGGDRTYLESAVTFLEADPSFYGSGYAKEDIIPAINRFDLPSKLVGRLRAVVLNMVDQRDGREFRAYCRLARKVDSPELREQLNRRLTRAWPSARSLTDDLPALMLLARQDRAIRRRARWVLEALGQKDTQG